MSNCLTGHGLYIDDIVFLSPREALPFLEGEAILVDLRPEHERSGREFGVRTVVSLPFEELAGQYEALLPHDRPLILADAAGVHVKKAIRLLQAQGYEEIAALNGGMVDWQGDGLPLCVDRGEQLTGSCTCQLRPKKVYGGSGC
jgi:rhodanese-related sulfurtransferase